MTAFEQINAIHSAVHVLKTLANETPVDATDNEIAVICAAEVAAKKLSERLERHYESEHGVPAEQVVPIAASAPAVVPIGDP